MYRLTVQEKQDIIRYRDENPYTSFRYIAQFFSEKLKKRVKEAVVIRTYKDREQILSMNTHMTGVYHRRKNPQEILLMDELNEEISIRNTLSPQILTRKYIIDIAIELAGQDKYGGYFEGHKFAERWVRTFRKLYNRPLKPDHEY